MDLNGRLLGMIVASLPEVSASYVIPATAIGKVRDDLLLAGAVQYGWIGIEVESQPAKNEANAPLVITSIVDTGPAEKGGLEVGDRIIQINGQQVEGINSMRHSFFLARVGQFLDFKISREGSKMDFSVQVGSQPKAPQID